MTDARQLRDALRALIVAHGSFDEAKRPCGTPLPMPYAHALLELNEHDGLSVTELAASLSIDRSNVSRLVQRLEVDGMVERKPHPTDGRATALYLTAEGERRAEDIDAVSAEHFLTLLERLNDAPNVIAALEQLTVAMENL
jgi:DNA-binding MarR family transcriptional regulator